jgi:hypothetical protein
MKEIITIGLVVFLALIAFSYFVSAGFDDWFKGITGKATSGTETVNISVLGITPVSVKVYNHTLVGTAVDPTEDGNIGLTFKVELVDTDGVDDINDNSVGANFSKTGEALRQNISCTMISGQSTSISQNFTCNITMWYFDAPGAWIINAWGNDTGNGTIIYNTTQTFSYDTLQAIVLSPAALTWASISPGQTNRTSSNDPTLINNTGNYNVTNITVSGVNLMGEVTNTYFIDAGNFTADIQTSAADVECNVNVTSGARLLNQTAEQVIGATLSRGNHSVNTGATGQEQLYYCIPLVPSVTTQSYSTPQAWTIAIV